MSVVARKSGVSTMTVYRHFPGREAIVKALWEDTAASQGLDTEFPNYARDLKSTLEGIYGVGYSRDELKVLTVATPLGKALRRALRQLSIDAYAARIDTAVKDLSDQDRTLARAVLLLFQNNNAWLDLRDDKKIGATDAIRAIQWAIEKLIEDLQTRGGSALHMPVGEDFSGIGRPPRRETT